MQGGSDRSPPNHRRLCTFVLHTGGTHTLMRMGVVNQQAMPPLPPPPPQAYKGRPLSPCFLQALPAHLDAQGVVDHQATGWVPQIC